MLRLALKVFAWIAGILTGLLLLVAALAYVLLETGPGHDFVLRTALGQIPNHVDGEVRVGALRSDGLLRGFTLGDVSIRDDRGRSFLEADSLRVRYSFRELLRGEIALVPAELWGTRVVLERLRGDEHLNVVRIFRLHEERDPAEEGSGVSVLLRQVQVHDGALLVRLPAEAEAAAGRGIVEAVEGAEGLHRRLEFSGLEARIREAEIVGPELAGPRVVFDRLALTAHVLDEPFELEELRGTVALADGWVRVDAEELRVPGTAAVGEFALHLEANDAGPFLEIRAGVRSERLAGLRWLEPRIPEGSARFELEVRGPLERSEWRISAADVEAAGSRVRGDLGFDLGDELRFVDTDLELLPLRLDSLEPWLDDPLPVEGRLQGRVRASGPFRALRLDAEVAFDDPTRELPTSVARLDGVLRLDGEPAAENLSLAIDPLRYPTLRAFAPELDLVGEGELRAELSGTLSTGLALTAELTHAPGPDGPVSRIVASGSVRGSAERPVLDLLGNVQPLAFEGIEAGLRRELPVAGTVTGTFRATGELDDLALDATLETPAGLLAFASRLDVLDPARGYRVGGRVEEFALHRVLRGVPEPTIVSGEFELDGRGLTIDDLTGAGRLSLDAVQVAEFDADRIDAELRAQGGRLFVETLELRSRFGRLDGSGDLALRDDVPEGRVAVSWETESLASLRPVLLGDRVIAADTLTPLERQILRVDGVDPDTLPDAEAIALAGRLEGTVELRGAIRDFEAEGVAEIHDGVHGDLTLEEGQVHFNGRWQGRDEWSVEGVVGLDRVGFGRYAFERADAEIAYAAGVGDATVRVRRDAGESYRLAGLFAVDDRGVDVTLETLVLDLEPAPWTLQGPARLRVEERAVRVEGLRVTRPAVGAEVPVQIEASGLLSLDGESDFQTEMWGVDIRQVAEMLHLDDPPEGILDLALEVRGPPDAPVLDGRFAVADLLAGGTRFSRVEGTLAYRDRLADAQLEAELGGRRLLRAEGRVPVDLSFREVDSRLADREMDVVVSVDSLPAASVLAFLDAVDDIEGVLEGRLEVRGTPREPRPSGEMRLRGGAASLPEQGLRVTGIGGTFRLSEDRVVQVSAEARARGVARMEGTITLAELADPGFDLRITTSNFQAVDRRDLNARVGGEIMLTGSYTRPFVQGLVRVEQGSLFLEEFARTAEVVDLTDPAFFDVVDTTVVAVRPIVAAAENPFVRNLRVDVDLAIARDFWLRSREMNVEMDGELMVTFDRPRRELLLVGTLEAVRGSYTAFGRQFQVQQGTVEFVGTPGINPSLDLQAVNRVRREGGEPLNVVANLTGTLENMRVDLSSDAQPAIAQSDLISYLVFGRPSYALGSGERSVLEGAAGAGVGVGLGAVATQLGSVVAQQVGVDYFTITQAREGAGLPNTAELVGALAQTQIEMGQYVGQNLFLAITLRPLTGLGARTQTQFPGARLEWRFTDLWTAEGFLEDRLAREAAAGFGELGFRLDKVLGLSLYREWGY